jgi:hypothetical protein
MFSKLTHMHKDEARSLLRIEETHINEAVVRLAFRRRVKEVHPDAGGSADLFHDIVHARTLLLNDLSSPLPTVEIRMLSDSVGRVAVQCPSCRGKVTTSTCTSCYGRGECKSCRGRGYITQKCAQCSNFGVVMVDVELSNDNHVVLDGVRYRAVSV